MDSNNRLLKLCKRLLVTLITMSSCSSAAFAESIYNLPVGVTPISHDIYSLHMITIWICAAIGVVVFGVLTYSLIKFRRSGGAVSSKTHEHFALEIVWTVIPFLILVAMAIPATIVLIRQHDTNEPYLNIKVTGYQWKWRYEYLDQGVSFFSNLSTSQASIDNKAAKDEWFLLEVDHPLVVPVGKKIRFLVTSNDVIHSWWIPTLGLKQDAVPGYINETWTLIETPGLYRGQCSELCGVNHAFMPIVVKAVPQKEFDRWITQSEKATGKIIATLPKNEVNRRLEHSERATGKATTATLPPQKKASQKLTKEELLVEGKKVYDENCVVCHQTNGEGVPKVFPAIKGDRIVIGLREPHILIVLQGKAGTAMQGFAGKLTNEQIAAVITYQRNAWGNDKLNKDTVIQPKDIADYNRK